MKTISKQELRAIRREWIDYYLKGNECIYATVSTVREAVRESEMWLFGCELKAYE